MRAARLGRVGRRRRVTIRRCTRTNHRYVHTMRCFQGGASYGAVGSGYED